MSESQNIESSNSMTRQQLLEHLQDIEWDNFEVKAARTDVPKDVWENNFYKSSAAIVAKNNFLYLKSGSLYKNPHFYEKSF